MASRIPFDHAFWDEYLLGQEARLPTLLDVGGPEFWSNKGLRWQPRTTAITGNQHLYHRYWFVQDFDRQWLGTSRAYTSTLRTMIVSLTCEQGDQQWIDTIADLLQNRHIELQYILLTHWHGDYTGGVQSLVAHDSKLADRIHKHMPDGDQQDISDGQIFAVEGATVRAVFTPGHAVDHMCFLLEEENALFTGDNVLGHGFSVVEDLGVYMRSIDTMAGLQCSTGYPGHGARIDKLPDKMKEYIVHKEFRARQVMSALSRTNRNGMSLTEVARSIYGEVPQEMIEKVLLPFLTQMMWNLAEDRIVGFAPGDPRMRKWFARPPIRRLHTV